MPTRLIREGILSSQRINSLKTAGAELLYRRIQSVADDYGRCYGSPATLRGDCWPTCPDKFTDDEIKGWLDDILTVHLRIDGEEDNPLVFAYEVKGAKYLQLTDFGQKIRSKSKYPPPPGIIDPLNCGRSENNLPAACTQPDNNLPENRLHVADNLKTSVHASRSRSRNSESESSSAREQIAKVETSRRLDDETNPESGDPETEKPNAPSIESAAPVSDHDFMLNLLHSYMGDKSPKPDSGIIDRCLAATKGVPRALIFTALREKFVAGHEPRMAKGPKGYAWFPAVLENLFVSNRRPEPALRPPSKALAEVQA